MSANKSANLNLHLWDKDKDSFRVGELAENFTTLDTKHKEHDDKIKSLEKVRNRFVLTATEGQTLFNLPDGVTYTPDKNLLDVHIEGVPQFISGGGLIETSPTSFTIETSESIPAGTKLYVTVWEAKVPSTIGHSPTHHEGGQDAIDVTKLVNYQTEIADRIGVLKRKTYFAEEYGIIPDYDASGHTGLDISPLLNTLIDTVYNEGGGTIFIPKGVYKIKNTVVMKPNVVIEGAGIDVTFLKMGWNTSNVNMFLFDEAANAGLKDITLEGTKSNCPNCNGIIIQNSDTSGRSFPLDNSRNLKIEHIRVYNFSNDGIQVKKVNGIGVWIFMLRFIKIDMCDGFGLYNEGTDNSFYMIDIFDCLKGAVKDIGANNRWIGGKWYVNGSKTNATNTATLHCSGARRTSYIGIECQDNFGHGLWVTGSSYDLSFIGCIFDSSGVLNGNQFNKANVYLEDNADRIRFTDCFNTNYLGGTMTYQGIFVSATCKNIILGLSTDTSRITNPLVITDGSFNIKDETNMYAPSRVSAYQSTLQSLTAVTDAKVLYQTETVDANGEYADSKFTAKANGVYTVNVSLLLASQNAGIMNKLMLYKNGSLFRTLHYEPVGDTNVNLISKTINVNLKPNDYIEIYINSGSTVNTTASSASSYLEITKISV